MMLKTPERTIDKLIDDVIKIDNIEYLIAITSKQDDVKAPIKGTELGALERYEVLPKAIRANANKVMNAIVEAMLALTDASHKKRAVAKLTEYLENELKQAQPNLHFIEYILTKGIAVTQDQDVNILLKIYRDNQSQNKKTVLELINFLIEQNRDFDNKFFQFAYLLKHLNKEEVSALITQNNFIEGILIPGLSSNHSDVIAQALKGSQAVKDNAVLLQKLLNDLLTQTQTAPNYNAINALITLGMKIENKDTFYNFIEKNLKDLATNQTLVTIFDVFLKDAANYDKKALEAVINGLVQNKDLKSIAHIVEQLTSAQRTDLIVSQDFNKNPLKTMVHTIFETFCHPSEIKNAAPHMIKLMKLFDPKSVIMIDPDTDYKSPLFYLMSHGFTAAKNDDLRASYVNVFQACIKHFGMIDKTNVIYRDTSDQAQKWDKGGTSVNLMTYLYQYGSDKKSSLLGGLLGFGNKPANKVAFPEQETLAKAFNVAYEGVRNPSNTQALKGGLGSMNISSSEQDEDQYQFRTRGFGISQSEEK